MTGHFHGRHRKGYMQTVREIKRTEAKERDAMTPEERAQRERERYELQDSLIAIARDLTPNA